MNKLCVLNYDKGNLVDLNIKKLNVNCANEREEFIKLLNVNNSG